VNSLFQRSGHGDGVAPACLGKTGWPARPFTRGPDGPPGPVLTATRSWGPIAHAVESAYFFCLSSHLGLGELNIRRLTGHKKCASWPLAPIEATCPPSLAIWRRRPSNNATRKVY
jgi:hypothetical protein